MKSFFCSSLLLGLISTSPGGTLITFDNTDFTVTAQFNRLRDFSFSLELDDDLAAGNTYLNPTVSNLDYNIFGILDTEPTPSGFPAFDLQRNAIDNAEFYGQGSSLEIEIAAGADLSDGLQLSELVTFILNAREDNTGRYHPAILTLSPDGTGFLQNSDNSGGINPGNGQVVDVDAGEEYQVSLAADPSLTIAVPEPGSALFAVMALALPALRRRRS